MKFEMQRDCVSDLISFRGEISVFDMHRLRLDNLDMAVIDDVSNDPKATAADYLLALEVLFRRYSEQTGLSPNGEGSDE